MHIRKSHHYFFLFIVILIANLSISTRSSAQPEGNSHLKMSEVYMGTATCASSNCHGNSSPIKGSSILQNEFVTWFRHDSHSKAYSVLLNEQSKRISHNLSIESAEKEPLCLSCHATFVPNDKDKGDKYRISDGVSCESCHGASSKWLKQHVADDSSHTQNVSLGMIDLQNHEIKTKLCLSCHLGNESKNVNHKLIGAGHPRLTFEQDTFESVMPRHWNTNSQNEEDARHNNPANTWLKAQVIQANERVKALYSKTRSHSGIFPEFSNMHCYSCHHPLSQHQYQSREYEGKPGQANLNTSELWILSKTLPIINEKKAAQLLQKTNRLRTLFGKEDITSLSKEVSAFLKDEIIPEINSKDLSKQDQEKIFAALVSASHLNLQYETAEQIAMGAAAIAASNPESEYMKNTVKLIYKALDNPELFDPKLFKKTPVR